MTLQQHAPMRRCGRRYKTNVDAALSKGALVAGKIPFECPVRGCGGWHLRDSGPGEPSSMAPGNPGKDTGPDRKRRRAVYQRDGYRCVCCGTPIENRPHSVGHRKRRSQGGGNDMSNLLTFLGLGINPLDPDDHHARIDSRRKPEDEARGYTVRSYLDPRLIGVMYFETSGSGLTRFLGDDGSLLNEPEAA